MSQYAEELRLRAVRPALERIAMWSPAAENLVLGTAAHESGGFRHRMQVGGGSALGLWQIEPDSHDDLYINYLDYRHELRAALIGLKTAIDADPYDELRDNDLYAAGVCRLIYRRSPDKLPDDPDDIAALAAIWKRAYNSALGKGTVQKFMADYARYVA